MSEEKIMSKEAFDELIENFEIVEKLTLYGRKSIKYHINQLQQENKQLKSLIENLQLGVTLNEKQEELLDNIMFGGDKHE